MVGRPNDANDWQGVSNGAMSATEHLQVLRLQRKQLAILSHQSDYGSLFSVIWQNQQYAKP